MKDDLYLRTSIIGFLLFVIKNTIATIAILSTTLIATHFSSNSYKFIYIFILIQIIIIIKRFFEWYLFRYKLNNSSIIIRKGIINIIYLEIEYNEIKQLNEHASFLERIFKISDFSLNIGVDSSDGTIKLNSLSLNEANKLKKKVKIESIIENSNLVNNNLLSYVYKPTIRNIFISSISSFQMIFVIIFIENITSNFNIKLKNIGNLFFHNNMNILFKLIILLLLISILIFLGFIKQYIRYGNFELFSDYNNLYTKSGFFNKTTTSINKENVYTLLEYSSIIMNLFKLMKVDAFTISSVQNDSISKDPIIPFISINKGIDIINKEFNELKHIPLGFKNDKLKIFQISILYSLLPIITLIVLFSIDIKIGYIFLFIAIIYIMNVIFKYIFTNICLNNNILNLRYGVLIKKQYITKIVDIE